MNTQKQLKDVYVTIRHFREMKNMTREQVSDALEITVSGYGKIERGEVDLSLSKLYKIAEILDVEVAQILNFKVSNVFNVSNSQIAQVSSESPTMTIYNNEYLEKYVKMLEKELERLKNDQKNYLTQLEAIFPKFS